MTSFLGVADLAPSRKRAIGDAVAVAASLLFGMLTLFLDFEEEVGAVAPVDIGLVLFGCLALSMRRAQPFAVALVVAATRLVMIPISDSEIALVLASIVGFYTLARSGSRGLAYGLGVVTVIATTATIMLSDTSESLPQELLGETAASLFAVALGDAARSRDERLTSLINAEASSRVQAERLRIARDLHDVVAHGLAAIAVQSGTAAHNLDTDDPNDPVRLALERINTTGKQSLEDLRGMVGVLRSSDETPLRPTPTDPNDFSELAESARLSGLDLTVAIEGSFPDEASDAVIVAAHRIAQEALTNVARHAGTAGASLELRHSDESARLRVVNGAATLSVKASASTGVGIIGMRERAESVGGSLETASLSGGGFEVVAILPYRQESS